MKNYKADVKKDLEGKGNLFKMSEISQQLELTPRTIRYYESEGLLGEVKRSIGYTRYFTNEDIIRLKEIKNLKQQGKKIAQIKDIFNKHPTLTQITHDNLAILSTLVEKDDISQCLKLGIEVLNVNIVVDSIMINYLDWQSMPTKEFSKNIQLEHDVSLNKITLKPVNSSTWIGNGMRSMVKELLRTPPSKRLTEQYVSDQFKGVTEWLILPVTLVTDYKYMDTLPRSFMLEKRHNGTTVQKILTLTQLFIELEKQIKMISNTANGFLRQITLHANLEHKNSHELVQFLNNTIQNKDRLSIEALSPVYIQSAGTDQAFLLSVYSQ